MMNVAGACCRQYIAVCLDIQARSRMSCSSQCKHDQHFIQSSEHYSPTNLDRPEEFAGTICRLLGDRGERGAEARKCIPQQVIGPPMLAAPCRSLSKTHHTQFHHGPRMAAAPWPSFQHSPPGCRSGHTQPQHHHQQLLLQHRLHRRSCCRLLQQGQQA